ncbi:MAG: peptide-methionine (S)-S-oxide reductase MsrA [Terriglobia bacterium]
MTKSLFAVPLFAAALMAATFPDPPAIATTAPAAKKATVVLAGGCFWGMQGVFEHVKGVTDTQVGYAGGEQKTAHYEMVSEGNTGHAESLKVTYDPSKITLGQLLKVYFSAAHDPTTLNYQHHDQGPQYRSAFFYADDEQKKLAEAYIAELNKAHVFENPIVTQVVPLKAFYAAEAYHQHFLDNNPTQGYIVAVDIPLLENFKRTFPELYKR